MASASAVSGVAASAVSGVATASSAKAGSATPRFVSATAVGVFVDFAVSYAFKFSGTGQSFAEAADAGEHIHKLDQGHNSLWGCLPHLRRCLIGTPHQKQKQPVTGCTKQDFFTVHYVSTSFCLLLFYLLLKHWNHPLQ